MPRKQSTPDLSARCGCMGGRITGLYRCVDAGFKVIKIVVETVVPNTPTSEYIIYSIKHSRLTQQMR